MRHWGAHVNSSNVRARRALLISYDTAQTHTHARTQKFTAQGWPQQHRMDYQHGHEYCNINLTACVTSESYIPQCEKEIYVYYVQGGPKEVNL